MASFCTKCGAELSPNTQFCATCGTPVTAPAAVVAPSQPVAPPAQSGGNALKIILIIVAVFVGLGILGGRSLWVFRVACCARRPRLRLGRPGDAAYAWRQF